MFQVIPTLAGQAALAAALANTASLTIAQMVIGDGNGAPITPIETQTNLVNLRHTQAIGAVTRVANVATFEATFGSAVGPFTIREAGLLDNTGTLLFVGSIPATEKLTPAQNAFDSLTIGLQVIVSDTADVTLQPPPGDLISIADMLRAPWMSVESMTITTPPGSPVAGATYRVPPGATGAWSGRTHELTQWNGSQWVFKAVPTTHQVAEISTGSLWRRTSTGWKPVNKTGPAYLHFYGCM
jgi:hypothetical protein